MDDMDGMQHPKMVQVSPIQTSGAAAEGSCKAKRTTEQLWSRGEKGTQIGAKCEQGRYVLLEHVFFLQMKEATKNETHPDSISSSYS